MQNLLQGSICLPDLAKLYSILIYVVLWSHKGQDQEIPKTSDKELTKL